MIYLYLYDNQLTGSIPPEWGNFNKLGLLALEDNQLSGTIPPQICDNSSLATLYLNGNQFTGAIPPELGNAHYLQLDNNLLTGSIPPELGNVSYLHVINNQLTGEIPSELSNVVDLYLDSNQLTGSIPPELGNVKELHLTNNQLTGSIPPGLAAPDNLEFLDLSGNRLTGMIPPELGNLTYLKEIYLNGNQLTGNIPPELCHVSLNELHLENNRLIGSIPPTLGYNNKFLFELFLNGNQLTGKIPEELGNLPRLKRINLSSNKLQGRIPSTFVNLTTLLPSTPTENNVDFGYNALFTNVSASIDFLNEKDPDWQQTQTIAPGDLNAAVVDNHTARISWTPVTYTGDTGGYRVYYSNEPKGPYTLYGQTAAKTDTSMDVTGLNSGTRYYFGVITRTNPHVDNLNTVNSLPGSRVSAVIPGIIDTTIPVGGETFYKGRQISIAWTTEGVTGDIKILLIRSDKSGGYSAASDIPYNSSPYDYTIPPEVSPGSYFVRVKNDNATPGDSGVFTISTASITVTAPAGGEIYSTGDSIPIAWTTTGITGDVKIGLVRSDRSGGYVITPGTLYNNSPFPYTIPGGVTPGTYFIVVKKSGVTKGKSGNITID